MATKVTRSVEIKRIDSGRRVVYGEVMLAAPDMQDGDTVLASQLEGAIHFDGAFMTQAGITELMDRFATKRPSIDVEHNGIPVGATVVESFQARAGDTEYATGAWVVGVKLHDDAVWLRVQDGTDLRAFSIQFMVRVDEIRVNILLDDGAVQKATLIRFSNGDPQFLSLVRQPATGAMWNRIDRSMETVLRDATRSRWTMPQENDDKPDATEETATASTTEVVEESRSADPKADDPADDAGFAKKFMNMIRRGMGMGSEVPRAKDEKDAAEDDDEDKDKDGKKPAFPGAAEEFKDGEEDETKDAKESKKQEGEDTTTEVDRAEMFADLLAEGANSMAQGIDALARTAASVVDTSEGDDVADTDKIRAALLDFATWGSTMLDSEDGGLAPFVAALSERSVPDADVERGAFSAAMGAREIRDDVWAGVYVLMDALSAIAASDETDKASAMKLAVAEFSVWINSKVDELATATSLSAEAFELPADIVARAGKKITGKRLAVLKDLAGKLSALIEELDDIVLEDVENSERNETPDDGAPEGAAAEVDRSAESGAAAQAMIKDPAAFLQALEQLAQRNDRLEERVRFVESARPPASGAGGKRLPPPPKTPEEVLMSAFGFDKQK